MQVVSGAAVSPLMPRWLVDGPERAIWALLRASPYDDHIGREAFFERCFPTADRFSRQELVHVTPAGGGDVFLMYEYDLASGGTYRNTELITVVDGRIVEIQVFFGGAVR